MADLVLDDLRILVAKQPSEFLGGVDKHNRSNEKCEECTQGCRESTHSFEVEGHGLTKIVSLNNLRATGALHV